MTAGVAHFELIILIELFARLYAVVQGPAGAVESTATTLVKGEAGVDQFAVMLYQIAGAIKCVRGFLATG